MTGLLTPYTKEEVEPLCILPYIIGSRAKCACDHSGGSRNLERGIQLWAQEAHVPESFWIATPTSGY